MKTKALLAIIYLNFFVNSLFAQNNHDHEILLINHDWILIDKYQIDKNKKLLGSYKMVFTNEKKYWRPGYRICLKNNGELTAGSVPLCGTGPQMWSSVKGYWELLMEDRIVFHYNENEIHYMNMNPPSEKKEVEFTPRKETYELTVINDYYIGLNLIVE